MCSWDKSVFTTLEWVVDQSFIAIKGLWVGLLGPDELICIYAPTDQGERIGFFETLAQFIDRWDCHNFILFGGF